MEGTSLSLIEKLLDALNITSDALRTASSIIISLGVILILGFLMTRLTKLLKLPNATAYILIGILIGPEGGLELEEIKYLNNIGFINISLGKRILRTETAAIYALSVISNILER